MMTIPEAARFLRVTEARIWYCITYMLWRPKRRVGHAWALDDSEVESLRIALDKIRKRRKSKPRKAIEKSEESFDRVSDDGVLSR